MKSNYLCVGLATLGDLPQDGYVDRKRLIVMLHELGEVQENLHDIASDSR